MQQSLKIISPSISGHLDRVHLVRMWNSDPLLWSSRTRFHWHLPWLQLSCRAACWTCWHRVVPCLSVCPCFHLQMRCRPRCLWWSRRPRFRGFRWLCRGCWGCLHQTWLWCSLIARDMKVRSMGLQLGERSSRLCHLVTSMQTRWDCHVIQQVAQHSLETKNDAKAPDSKWPPPTVGT